LISSLSFIESQKAPSAHLSRFGRCTNGVYLVSVTKRKFSQWEVSFVAPNYSSRLALAYCVMWISSSLFTWPRK